MEVKFSFQNCNDSENCMISYCERRQTVVSHNKIIHSWDLEIKSGICEPGKELELRIDSDPDIVGAFKLSRNYVNSKNWRTEKYSFTVTFSPNSHIFIGKEYVSYKVCLYHKDKVLKESESRIIQLNSDSHCEKCQMACEEQLFDIVPVKEIVYSDMSYQNREFQVATLVINPDIVVDENFRLDNIGDHISFSLNITCGCNQIPYKFAGLVSPRLGIGCYKVRAVRSDIQVIIDMRNIPVPETGSKLVFEYNYEYTRCNRSISSEKCSECPIRLSPDFVCMDVALRQLDISGNDIESAVHANAGNWLQPIYLQQNATTAYNLRISNRATATDGRCINKGLRITDATITLDLSDEEVQRFEGRPEFKIDTPSGTVTLLSGNAVDLGIEIQHDVIKNIRVENNSRYMDLRFRLQFMYIEERVEVYNECGFNRFRIKESDWSEYSCTLHARVHRKEAQIWHSVDFGTSAVVACYLDRQAGTTNIVDLRLKKNQLLMEAYPDDDNKRRDATELTDKLIASTLYLNPVISNERNLHGLRRQTLWFSPASGMVNEQYQLPCLKNMMGHPAIPAIPIPNRELLGLSVSDVMRQAYSQLFEYYVNSNERIETLVLTVPNTFTHIHIEQIKRIVLQNLRTLSEDSLYFISESDAVLCSYVKEKNRIFDDRLSKASEEHVLVYDIGAGTLDITYAVCHFENGYCKIDILNKIGVNKAGNFIDYLLGEIICELLDSQSFWSGKIKQWMKLEPGNTEYNSRKALKDYLRNIVKVRLNENADKALPSHSFMKNNPSCSELENIKIGDILSHTLFEEYLRSCSKTVLDDLFNGIDKRIDVVLLSGRTISINAIRDKLMDTLKVYVKNDVEYINMNRDGYSLKTVVAKGALDYMQMARFNTHFNISKSKIYGCYGILVFNDNRAERWMPVIDRETAGKENGEYENVISVGIGNIDKICLCHSFCKDTLSMARTGNYDSISVLHSYCVPSTDRMETIKVELRITAEDTLSYTIGNTVINDLYPRDDYNNESLKKSLWPVIYKTDSAVLHSNSAFNIDEPNPNYKRYDNGIKKNNSFDD